MKRSMLWVSKGKGLWIGLCVLLLMACIGWIATHVRQGTGGIRQQLAHAMAQERAQVLEQTLGYSHMPVAMPAGDIRVNTAGVEELTRLSGVGPSLAEAIIAEREANGIFTYPEDLLNVKGIGEKKLAGFVEQITLE